MVSNELGDQGSADDPLPTSSSSNREGPGGLRGDVTQVLSAIEQGDGRAAEQLLPLVYEELRRLAAAKMAQERPGQTLQATALVHEAYLRLVGRDNEQLWNSRGHFYAAAAEAMRRILVESVRSKQTVKHGGEHQRVDWAEADLVTQHGPTQFLILNDVIDRLTAEDSHAGGLAKLRLFAGLSVDEAAKILQLPHTTAYRHWTYARAWLQVQLDERQ